jgi:hypothetical protein
MLGLGMHKLTPVEEAKALFEEAKDWGVWKWLTEKPRARRSADAAWEAFDEYEEKVKAAWSDDLRKAWRELEAQDGGRGHKKAREEAKDVDPEIKAAAGKLKKADQEAYQARMDAEAQFDEADRRMSAAMAREGAQMAIDAWVQRERFIRKMEALGRKG